MLNFLVPGPFLTISRSSEHLTLQLLSQRWEYIFSKTLYDEISSVQSVYSFVKYVTHDLAKYADQKTSRIAFVAIETDFYYTQLA